MNTIEKKPNELKSRAMLPLLQSIKVQSLAGFIPMPTWNIPVEFDEPLPLKIIDEMGMKFAELYFQVFGIRASYTAIQELVKIPTDADIKQAEDVFKNSIQFNHSNGNSYEGYSPDKAVVEEEETSKVVRPNHGIGRAMRSYWKHQKFGETQDVQEVFEVFKTAFPKLDLDTFILYSKRSVNTGGIKLVFEHNDTKIRKVDDSPMKC